MFTTFNTIFWVESDTPRYFRSSLLRRCTTKGDTYKWTLSVDIAFVIVL